MKVIWSETEKKLKPEDEVKLAESEQLASETALAAISIDDVMTKSVDPHHISKIWESDRAGGTATLPIKTKSVWEPRPAEQVIFLNSLLNFEFIHLSFIRTYIILWIMQY